MTADGRIAESPWALHDPGGRSTFALADGVAGSAAFSGCGRCRRTLTRTLDSSNPLVAVFIGANPSTARTDADDPTVSRETGVTRRIGCGSMIKVNVMDYRATDPSDLLAPGVAACSAENLDAIMEAVSRAHVVVACHGACAATPTPSPAPTARSCAPASRCCAWASRRTGFPGTPCTCAPTRRCDRSSRGPDGREGACHDPPRESRGTAGRGR